VIVDVGDSRPIDGAAHAPADANEGRQLFGEEAGTPVTASAASHFIKFGQSAGAEHE
jgi:hypothetical protein